MIKVNMIKLALIYLSLEPGFPTKKTFKCLWLYGFKSLISDKTSNQHVIFMSLFDLSLFELGIYLTYRKSC